MVRVVFVLVPRLHLLDLAGPAQVFQTATDLGLGYELHYVAETDELPSAQGVSLRAETVWPELTAADLVVAIGWRGMTLPTGMPVTEQTLGALRDQYARGGTVASVCSGADLLGRAGLLDGRRCTTHHDLQDELQRRYPAARVQRDVLFTADGRVVTSAGIASGIDLSLYLVAAAHGPAVAARIARALVVYARRNGDEPQHSAMLRHRDHVVDAVHRVQNVIDARFDETLPLPMLARQVGVSERTLTRLFAGATGTTPLRYQQALRLERAETLIGQGSTVEAAARAAGFDDSRMLRRLRARSA